jgi:hypothetical protein
MIGDCADSWLSWTGPGTGADVQSEGGDGGERGRHGVWEMRLLALLAPRDR